MKNDVNASGLGVGAIFSPIRDGYEKTISSVLPANSIITT